MNLQSPGQIKPTLLVAIGLLTAMIALPVVIARLYKPSAVTYQPEVAGAQTLIDPISEEAQIDLNQDGVVDILDYTISTGK